MASRWAAIAAAAALGALSGAARAEPSDRDRELARALDAEAEQAIAEGHLDKALARYERSAALVDVPAHWLMIGRLRAQLGKPASAIVALERAAKFTLRPGAHPAQKRAVDRAKAELAELRPRVPTLTVRVIGATPSEVTIDGAPVDLASLDEPQPLDPGSHRVVARAAGLPPAVAQQTLSMGEQTTLELRFIEAPRKAEPAAAQGSPVTAGFGYAALGVGGLAVVAGAVTGLATLARASQLADDCPKKTACPAEDQAVIDEARALGTASTVSFVVGGASLVTGVVLVLVGKRGGGGATAAPTAARVTPWLGPGAGGLRGTF